MRDRSIIKRFISVALLLVFTLAIAPKQLLHDAVATHKHHFDKPSPKSILKTYQFVCNCDNLVAESPFVDFTETILINPQVEYSAFLSLFNKPYQDTHVQSFRLRGPPSLL